MLLLAIILLHLSNSQISSAQSDPSPSSFHFNGFRSANLSVAGDASNVTRNGLLQLTNPYERTANYAFYPTPIAFKGSPNSSVSNFSTHFVFQINPNGDPNRECDFGMTFFVAPTTELSGENYCFGLFTGASNGNASNHIFAVEIDTRNDASVRDIDSNHVGIDINGVHSESASTGRYYLNDYNEDFRDLILKSNRPLHLWVNYVGGGEPNPRIEVAVAPLRFRRRTRPILSLQYDLSGVINQRMYVGFSAAACGASTYVLGWSFAVNEALPDLDISTLPRVPTIPINYLRISLISVGAVLFLLGCGILGWFVARKIKYSEIMEGWELEYVSHRFKYKDLHTATRGFKATEVVGRGGFGKVYKGVLPGSNMEVAVKRISHESKQGIKEFVAEIVTIGRLRHRNLAPLLGYCRRKKEFLLVYEYMPNGSLDKHLHSKESTNILNWEQRFHIIKGVAYGLLYLHQDFEQVVIHRDIKPSNVLLDRTWNARLGDFGLARLHDHGSQLATTKIVGTIGYIAPEHTRTGKATTSSDVYGFGAFLLEVATGRRPTEADCWLVNWVHSLWSENRVLDAVDPKLGSDFCAEEVEFVLKLGLLCSHVRPEIRPSMKDVVGYLEKMTSLPENLFSDRHEFLYEGSEGVQSSVAPSSSQLSGAFTISNSLVSVGR